LVRQVRILPSLGPRVVVDFLVARRKSGSVTVALEADGPRQFLRNQPRTATGSTVFRHKLLRQAVARGEVSGSAALPYWEWRDAAATGAEEQLLRKALARAGLEV
jgi:hypothetical protein